MENQNQGLRKFVIIWAGQLVSMIGSGLIGFALSVWIFTETGKATPFAITALLSTLPRILLSPIAGVITDRWNRKKIMLISDSLSGLITLATAALLLTNEMQVWIVYLISFLGSIFASFQQPAYAASIVMMVSKKQLTRANSMIQMGQALESLLTPVLAGILVTTIGMRGIIIIDFITYIAALLTLIFVKIPQPEVKSGKAQAQVSMFADFIFGWHYLIERKGLFYLLLYFASVNFFMNLAFIMVGPLVLSFDFAASMGVAQTVLGAGMLIGSLIMSVWGGTKKNKIWSVIGFITLASLGFLFMGFQPSLIFIGIGVFTLAFFLPFGSGPSSALFAEKIAPDVQGRVLSTRSMISQSMMPLAFLLSGILADKVFNPLLDEGGRLANTFIGKWIGVGAGRGIGLMIICSGILLILISAVAYANPRIRHIETEIPDAVIDTSNEKISTVNV